jgi:hypothetical protein
VLNFQDRSTQMMIDILKLLNEKASSDSLGESAKGQETIFSTLLRMIGVTQAVNYSIEGTSGSASQTKEKDPNLVDDFFKSKVRANELQLTEINNLLVAYKKRLLRYSKAKQSIKLNRLNRLVEQAAKPIDPVTLVAATPELTRKNVTQQQKSLIENRDFQGIIDQEIALNRALELSVGKVAEIPETTGDFRNQLIQLLRATASETQDTTEDLELYKQEVQLEVNKLKQQEKLLFSGIDDPSGSKQKLSLMKVLDVLIFLTDTKKIKYDCSQCKFFREGKTSACIYAGEGAIAQTRPVTIVDKQTGQPVGGHLSRPTDSCKQIWNLEKNDYYEFSPAVVELLSSLLKG